MVKPEDKQKAMLLVVAIVAVLGFVIWRVMGAIAASPAPATTSPALGMAPGQAQPLPAAPGGQPMVTQPGMTQPGGQPMATQPADDRTPYAANGRRPDQGDPFQSPLPKTGPGSSRGSPAPVTIRSGPLPSDGGGGLGSMPVAPEVPKTTIEVKGVVFGGQSFAVVKMGERTMHLYESDEVAKGIWVKQIRPSEVVFATKDGMIPVEIGGSYSAVFFPVRSSRKPRFPVAEKPIEHMAERRVETEPVAEEPPPSPPKPKPTPKPERIEQPKPPAEPPVLPAVVAPRPIPVAQAPAVPRVIHQPRPIVVEQLPPPKPVVVRERPIPKPKPVVVEQPAQKPVAAEAPPKLSVAEPRLAPQPRPIVVEPRPILQPKAVAAPRPARQPRPATEPKPEPATPKFVPSPPPTGEPAKPTKAVEYGPV